MSAAWIDGLNDVQRRAVTHPEGAVLVIAGAGTGKTKTLACRLAWLIDQGTAPDRILLLTFTRRAAAEMTNRAANIMGQDVARRVWAGTFHAMANRLLREHGQALSLSPNFTVMDQADSADMMNLIRGELELGSTKRRFPKKNTLNAIYSRCVNGRTKLVPLLDEFYPWCQEEADGIRQVFELYTKRKRKQHVLDFDDLLLYWKVLATAPRIGVSVARRFDHVLVDEYQDTNLLQAEILQAMCRERHNIMVVGDDAQSIYSFRAANVRNILDFPEQFEAVTLIKLEENYRSTQPILNAANAVMTEAKNSYTKHLYTHRKGRQKPAIITCLDEAEQCRFVCEHILTQLEEGVALQKQAVLFRAAHHSDQLEVELSRRNIPFVKYGGLKFVEASHVKDVLAILRIMENPGDQVSWYRVLQLLEGIGPVSARRMLDSLLSAPADEPADGTGIHGPVVSLLNDGVEAAGSVPAAARESFGHLRSVFCECLGQAVKTERDQCAPLGPDDGRRQKMPLVLAAQIERIGRFYEPICQRLHDNADVRLRDLEQLEQIARRYTSRSQFITDLAIDQPNSTQNLAGPPLLDEDYLILSTIHSAKGCEWDAVHIIHAADGMIPSDMATGSEKEIEEERRLLYVAMTRARNTLNFYFPLRYYHRNRGLSDRHSYAQLTRFIGPSTLELFDRLSGQGAEEASETGGTSQPVSVQSIDSMLNDLWQNE